MDFGRLEQVDHLDFKLPPSPDGNLRVLKKASAAQTKSDFKAFVGMPIWANKEWVGSLYPKGTLTKDYLHLYSHQFNTIELNSTHYSVPDAPLVAHWKEVTPADFKFCPKFPQEISHLRLLRHSSGLAREFCASMWQLGRSRLGLFFLQLPPHFSPQELRVFENFLDQLPRQVPLSVEFRNPHWFNNNELITSVLTLLERYQISTVITDTAGRREVMHQNLSTPKVLIRFVANSLHASDYTRVDEWVERLAEWKESGLEELYFFIHEPDKALQLHLAAYVIDRFNKVLKTDLKKWELPQGKVQEQLPLL